MSDQDQEPLLYSDADVDSVPKSACDSDIQHAESQIAPVLESQWSSHYIDLQRSFRLDPVLLGQGGQRAVWTAVDCRNSNREVIVAVKIYHDLLDTDAAKGFSREVSILKDLKHEIIE